MQTILSLSPSILAFVEGVMERIVVNNNFHYVRVIPIENGASWTAETLAKQISSKYYVANANPDVIIVWLDREDPARSIAEVKEKITSALVSRGAESQKIHICIPDLMTENIILADETAIKDVTGVNTYVYEYEGKNGKAELKKHLALAGRTYSETQDGVFLLKKIRLSQAAKKSPSAAEFLASFPVSCWWIKSEPSAPQ